MKFFKFKKYAVIVGLALFGFGVASDQKTVEAVVQKTTVQQAIMVKPPVKAAPKPAKVIKKRVVRRVVRPKVVTKKIKVVAPVVKAPKSTVVVLPAILSTSLPTELATTTLVASSTLTSTDIVTLSNNERAEAGLGGLTANPLLTQMAERKARDILAKQYFEHVSPTGVGVGDLAREAGYDYALVGENLALGNFGTSQAVVTGWMNSPGHRANILHKKFTEIGVAAVTGTYEGRPVWVAVQEFGFPRAACPAPDQADKERIAVVETDLREHEVGLKEKLRQLSAITNPTEYNRVVEEYNVLVRAYNDRVNELKGLVNSYNAAVDKMAACLK